MPDRWPAAMRIATAAEYVDVSVSKFRTLNIPSFQHNKRGDRFWLREDLDAYLNERRNEVVNGRRSA